MLDQRSVDMQYIVGQIIRPQTKISSLPWHLFSFHRVGSNPPHSPGRFLPTTSFRKETEKLGGISTTSNHGDRPILRRIFETTHRPARDSVGSMSITTVASFHSWKSIISHVESRWIEVNGGASDGLKIKEGNQIEEMELEGAKDIPEDDDDGQFEESEGTEGILANNNVIQIEGMEGAEDIPAINEDGPIYRTYRFDNCHVYMNSFNARGVNIKNSGNNAPQVTRESYVLFSLAILM